MCVCVCTGAQVPGSGQLRLISPDRLCYTRHSLMTHARRVVSVLSQENERIVTVSPLSPILPPCCICCIYVFDSQDFVSFVVYDNKIEQNKPVAACGPLTCSDGCVVDHITVLYFDQPPFTTGLSDPCCRQGHEACRCNCPCEVCPGVTTIECACIPIDCCGRPVIFSHQEASCCCSCYISSMICGSYCNELRIRHAPCSMWNCRECFCCCCGDPCYLRCSNALTWPLT